MNGDRIKGHLEMLLLGVLADGPGHGYAVITGLRERSGGVIDLQEGSVYPALHRLEGRGLLASEWERVAGRRRRLYRLTDAGRRALEEQTREWRALTGAVERVVGASVGGQPRGVVTA
jgi:transcriptional regulator